MKPKLYPFDKRLYELLQREKYRQFTTLELRDGYAQYLEKNSFLLSDLRRYVYEQIRRMLRLRWLTLDEERKKLGQVYHLRSIPNNVKLSLLDHGFENSLKLESDFQQVQSILPPQPEAHFAITTQQLEVRLKETRLDFLSSVGEAEGYKILLDEMPELKEQIENDYLEARDRSSRLLGHVRAIEKTLNSLVSLG